MNIKLFLFFFIFSFYSFSQSNKDEVVFSHNSGVYNESFLLTLTNVSSDKIYYFLNGGTTRREYKKPLLLNKSTTIKVKNRKSKVSFIRNFLFPGRKITLPIVCIAMEKEDLFSSSKGIYAKGPNASPEPPYKGANFHKHWERSAQIEFIDTNNNVGFNQKTGIKIFGQFSSSLPQKSFSIHARKKYGKGKINYPLFPSLPFKKYKSFVLRNAGSDNCNSHFRDVMMTSLVKNFNIETQDYRPCVVFLNGKYWGIYHLREKINEHYLKQHFKIDKKKIAILKHKYDVQYYGELNYKKVLKFVKKRNLKKNKNIIELSKLIDIDNYLDYNISQVYFGNIDAGGNIRYWREQKKGGKWRWILFDTDFGFGLKLGIGPDENTLKRATTYSSESWPYPSWSTQIIRSLLKNDSIKNCYIQKFSYYLNTTFKSENVINHINDIVKQIEKEIPFHFKKWKKNNDWKKNVEIILNFAEKRPDFIINHMIDKFKLDSVFKIDFSFNENQGAVYFNERKINSNYSGKHFNKIFHRIKAEPKFGYNFSHWTNGNTNQEYEFKIRKDTIVSAFFIKKDNSKYNGQVHFNEIRLKSKEGSSYIELYNNSEKPVDISNWILLNGINKTIIKQNTWIKPKSFFTIFNISSDTNNRQENIQFNQIDLNKGNEIIMFTNKEEFVDQVNLKKRYFRKTNTIELIKTIFKKRWVPSKKGSINETNKSQEKTNMNTKVISIIFTSLFSLFVLLTFLIIRKTQKKRKTRAFNAL